MFRREWQKGRRRREQDEREEIQGISRKNLPFHNDHADDLKRPDESR